MHRGRVFDMVLCGLALGACGPPMPPGADELLLSPTDVLVNVSTRTTSLAPDAEADTPPEGEQPLRIRFTLSGRTEFQPAESAGVYVTMNCPVNEAGNDLGAIARFGVDDQPECRLVADTQVTCTLSIAGTASFWAEVLTQSSGLRCDIIASTLERNVSTGAALRTTTGLPPDVKLKFNMASTLQARPMVAEGTSCGSVFRSRDCSAIEAREHTVALTLSNSAGIPVASKDGLAALALVDSPSTEAWFSSDTLCNAASATGEMPLRSVEQRFAFPPGSSASAPRRLCVGSKQRSHRIIAAVNGERDIVAEGIVDVMGQPATLFAQPLDDEPYETAAFSRIAFTFLDCSGSAIPNLPVGVAASSAQEALFRVVAGRQTDANGTVEVMVMRTEAGLAGSEKPILRVSSPLTAQTCEFQGEGL